MEFGLSKEQKLIVNSIREYLTSNVTLERVRQFVDDNETRADDLLTGLRDLDVTGILVDEKFGGIGLKLIDAALVAETLGNYATPVPYVASQIMVPLALSLAGSEEQQRQWLPKIADGSMNAGAAVSEVIGSRLDAKIQSDGSVLSGKGLFVLDFEADLYLVADDKRALYLVDANASGLNRQILTTIDKTRRVGELVFDKVTADPLSGSSDPEICAKIIDAGRIILAADTLGAAQNMLDQAVAYSKQREQFGRVIGSFQAVKHMCAEMVAHLEPCRAMMWYSAYAFDDIPEESRLTACLSKAHISDVGTFVAKTSTEVHGGMGFTDEHGLHYWFKRIGANRQLLGGPELLREEAAKLQDLI